MRKPIFAVLVAAGAVALVIGSGGRPFARSGHPRAPVVYVAELHALNSNVSGEATAGEARFTRDGDALTIRIDVRNAPPGIEHWQHFHGFKDNRPAACATAAQDVNHDGIIDIVETEPVSGITMVPFNADPVAMQVVNNTYPKAGANGSYHYEKTVSWKALQAAFTKAYNDQELDLERRVVYIHGVPTSTRLPATVASLGTIPAQVTLPIACGPIRRVSQ